MLNEGLLDAIHWAEVELQGRVRKESANGLSLLNELVLGLYKKNEKSEHFNAGYVGQVAADILSGFGDADSSDRFLDFFLSQLLERRQQKSLADLCAKAWEVWLGCPYEEMKQEFDGRAGSYINPLVCPEHFSFPLLPEKTRIPVSLVTFEEYSTVAELISFVQTSAYERPNFAHALFFALKHQRVLERTQIVVPCEPWIHPSAGPLVPYLSGSANKQIKLLIDVVPLDQAMGMGNTLVLVVGKNQSAQLISRELGGYKDNPY